MSKNIANFACLACCRFAFLVPSAPPSSQPPPPRFNSKLTSVVSSESLVLWFYINCVLPWNDYRGWLGACYWLETKVSHRTTQSSGDKNSLIPASVITDCIISRCNTRRALPARFVGLSLVGGSSSQAMVLGEGSTSHFPIAPVFVCFEMEISSRTSVPLFRPASCDDCGRAFLDELRVCSFSW